MRKKKNTKTEKNYIEVSSCSTNIELSGCSNIELSGCSNIINTYELDNKGKIVIEDFETLPLNIMEKKYDEYLEKNEKTIKKPNLSTNSNIRKPLIRTKIIRKAIKPLKRK